MSQKIARERIQRLFQLADQKCAEGREDPSLLATRYIQIAREIGMKYKVSIPSDLRKRYCHECLSFLKPGVNCRVRINSKNNAVNYYCKDCGKVNRYGF
jgi:ribonuclease P protein subunit RPR2